MLAQVLGQLVLVRSCRELPRGCECRYGLLHGLPVAADNTDEGSVLDDVHLGDRPCSVEVGRAQLSPCGRRLQRPALQRARPGHVAGIEGCAGHDRQPVLSGGRRQRRGRRADVNGSKLDAALARFERASFQRPPGGSGGRAEQRAGIRHRATSERASVIRAEIGVTHHQPHRIGWDAERRGHEQREPRPVSLPDVDFARERGHGSVGIDMEPGACAGRPTLLRRVGLDGNDEPVGQHCEPIALGRGHEIPRLRRPTEHGSCGDGATRKQHLLLQLRGRAYGPDDPRIGAAPADVSVHRGDDRRLGRIRVGCQQCRRRHDHPRRAVPALERSHVEERPLQRMEPPCRRQPLQRRHRLVSHVGRRHHAGSHRLAVDENRASPAYAFPAAWLRGGQSQLLAEHRQQRPLRPAGRVMPTTVDDQQHRSTSRHPPGPLYR